MYRLQHLATLHAVVATGSFALAARELGYTPSAVSQQVAALERDTGLVLFERQAHAVRVTAAGHRIAELARGILAGVEELRAEAGRWADGQAGQVRIGAFPTAGERIVPGALAAVAAKHPHAEVILTEGEPSALLDPLAAGELDIALVYEYALRPRSWPDALVDTPLLHEDLLLLRPAEERETTPSAHELATRRWIASGRASDGATALVRWCAAAGFEPNVVHHSDDYDVVRELVVAVRGVAMVPALGHRPDTRITATATGARRTVHVLHRRGDTNPLLPVVLSALRAAMPTSAHLVEVTRLPHQ
ncbi:LysR family transcriptional regulator [Pseudonocardia oroxyli]|uniref:DNA-binding transcriptional regulator, LysR family n=1 Tax=Pseudonocardia oroxyli TaxID=366584 RepID=A0A1G7SSP0_PSEOR|nr:LysR family transcriptional regulator [Pseudonocardia oroxyli]SDG26146.1 DNA-binding transcriptional regulator, LysR family [Pseudonocardia oroxyli]